MESIANFLERATQPYIGIKLKNSIKVALIDDGVNLREDAIYDQFREGWPQDYTNDSSGVFYHSEEGHGTEMAKCIKFVCPQVELYIAKIDMIHRTQTASSAAKVRTRVLHKI
jgi:hypothetical protein